VVARYALTTGYHLSRLRRGEALGLKNKNAATIAAALLIT
jgi:hypothetical protein